MNSNDQLLKIIESHISQIALPAEPARLYEPITYTLEEGGKRLRPMLLALAYQLYGRDINKEVLSAAAAVEVFHNFTLLHDDIMDNAATRRGKPSVHTRWGANVAILSGDVMMILAYQLLSNVNSAHLPQVLKTFNNMAAEVCEGQQYDMDFEQQSEVSIQEYMRMIELKTSVLLGGATLIGGIIGGASEGDCELLENFATQLGLAFQLQDDLLDTYGDEKFGKPIGGDILEGKQTYLKIMALRGASAEVAEELLTTHQRDDLSDIQKIEHIRSIYDSLGVAQLTSDEIERRFTKALNYLEAIECDQNPHKSSAKEQLRHYAMSLMNREK